MITQFELQQEFNKISIDLERLNGVFCQFWDLGKPVLTEELPTAAVAFNDKGASIEFLINPVFWSHLNYETKLFLISHECMHVILDHGKRSSKFVRADTTTEFEKSLTNIAMDVVINETIVKHFGMSRSSLNFADAVDAMTEASEDSVDVDASHPASDLSELKHGAFIDTVFGKIKPDVSEDMSYEYYYSVLSTHFKEKIKDAKDQQEMMKQIMKAISQMSSDDHEKLRESMDGKSGDAGDAVVKQIVESADKDAIEELSDAMNASFGKGYPGDPLIAGALKRKIELDYRKVKKLRKWQTLFRRCVKKIQEEAEDYQWVHPHRRQTMLPKDYLLPCEGNATNDDNRFMVWLFIDSSGSCHHLKDQFFKAAYSLDPKYFNVKLFSRTTEVCELDYKKPEITGYGSDDYRCIERHIQDQLSKRKIGKYPEIVMHFTDGHDCSGHMVKPQKPMNWFWFLTDEMYTRWVPKECVNGNRVFKLSDFES